MSLLKHFFQLLGMYGVGISLLLGFLLSLVTRFIPLRHGTRIYIGLIYGAFILSAGCSVAYLTYPNFMDHVEPTIWVITQIWLHAGEIYPPVDAPSAHGLLYGPALYWTQIPFAMWGWDSIVSTKMAGIIAFNLSWIVLFRLYQTPWAKGYLVFLLPFNLILFWSRAEPFFLLIMALAAWLVEQKPKHPALWLGLLAGVASSLKAHGALYVLPFVIFCVPWTVAHMAVFASVTVSVVLSFFFVPGVSLSNYLTYLELASAHGISGAYLEKNLFFLACIWIPLIWTLRHSQLSSPQKIQWAGLLLVEILISAAGAKPGAGVHHLIPVIAANSYLFERQLRDLPAKVKVPTAIKLGTATLAFYILSFAWINVYDSEVKSIAVVQSQRLAASEIQEMSAKYPKLLMGVTDKENENYRLTFLRPYLFQADAPQFDFAAFMDLHYSGISADFLANEFKQCKHLFVAMPKQGEPFAILNFYNNAPLFSDAVRHAFAAHYREIETGEHFVIYKCHL